MSPSKRSGSPTTRKTGGRQSSPQDQAPQFLNVEHSPVKKRTPSGKQSSVEGQTSHKKRSTPGKQISIEEQPLLQKPASSVKQPLTVERPSRKKTFPSKKELAEFPQGSPGAQLLGNEPACAAEQPVTKVPLNLTAIVGMYLLFALLLVGVRVWSPVQPALSPNQNIPFESDLTGQQEKFEDAWRASLIKIGLTPDALEQTVSSRLEEKHQGANTLRWIRSETILKLPPADNELQLMKAGMEWKANSVSFGFSVSKVLWGFSHQSIWVRLENEAEVPWGQQTHRLPIQGMMLVQPLASSKRHQWNLQGLIPITQPGLTGPAPEEKSGPPIATPFPKPQVVASPTPVVTAISSFNGQVPRSTPKPFSLPDATAVTLPPIVKIRAKVAIIIDDVGYLMEPAQTLLKVPAPLTWSVLPFTPHSGQLIEEGRAHGFEIMLHLPLEPIDQVHNNPGPGVIRIGWTEEEVRKQLDDDLKAVLGVAGINNHMGSAGTADDTLMDILMRYIKEKGLFFIDSETSNHSVVEKCTHQYGVPTARRNVFIDNQSSLESKKEQLRELIKIALKKGSAIGIGHTREGTGEAILEMLPEIVKAGVKIVPVSELVR